MYVTDGRHKPGYPIFGWRTCHQRMRDRGDRARQTGWKGVFPCSIVCKNKSEAQRWITTLSPNKCSDWQACSRSRLWLSEPSTSQSGSCSSEARSAPRISFPPTRGYRSDLVRNRVLRARNKTSPLARDAAVGFPVTPQSECPQKIFRQLRAGFSVAT
jgi:hypothetical protein